MEKYFSESNYGLQTHSHGLLSIKLSTYNIGNTSAAFHMIINDGLWDDLVRFLGLSGPDFDLFGP